MNGRFLAVAIPLATLTWAGLGMLGSIGSIPEVAGAGFFGAGVVQVMILLKLVGIERRLSYLEGKGDADKGTPESQRRRRWAP